MPQVLDPGAVKTLRSNPRTETVAVAQQPANQQALFSVSEDGGRLRMHVGKGTPELPSTLDALRSVLKKQGLGDFFLYEDELQKWLHKKAKAPPEGVVDIGERRDGTFEINIADDELEALATITPPYRGVAISKEQVRAALREKNVVYGVLSDVIDREVKKPSGTPVVVARGKRPEAGADAQLVSKLAKASEKRPKVRQDGTVEFRELGMFIVVRAGDVLMERIPAQPGISGINIYGQVVPAKTGKDLQFATNLEGTCLDPRNPDRLIAAVAGLPRPAENGMWVDQNLTIKDVDLSTGNVYMEGDVSISGDVTVGMRVVASGSITIGGTVEAAYVEAGGDITVTYGAIGHGDVRLTNGELNPSCATLKARGNVTAKFLNNAYVEAGGDVLIHEMVAHSVINLATRVTVGDENAKKGHILGGETRAEKTIHAHVIGSAGDVRTVLHVGVATAVVERQNDIHEQLRKRREELAKLSSLDEQLRVQPKVDRPDLPEKIARARKQAEEDVANLEADIEHIQSQVDAAGNVTIVASKKVFGGVHVTVNGKNENVTRETGPGTFAIRDGVLTYE